MKKTKERTACVNMTGPDNQMDTEPENSLAIACQHCTFPDLDSVASPYLLTRGISSPAEMSSAELGNFLVRDRVRRILELVVTGACVFHPTAERKSKKPAPWWLATPANKLPTSMPKPRPPFCSKCRRPKTWQVAMGEVWSKMVQYDSMGVDIFKGQEWYSGETAEESFAQTNDYRKKEGLPPLPWSNWGVDAPTHAQRWTRMAMRRDLYFSVRLEQLLKRAKIKGQLVRSYNFRDVKPTAEDEMWIQEKLALLARHGLVESPGAGSGKKGKRDTAAWFQKFLSDSAKKGVPKLDFGSIEKKQKLRLPADYKTFILAMGSKSFPDVTGEEGYSVRVLAPARLDFKSHRRGQLPYLEGDQAKVDGVVFATAINGDTFVFDMSGKGDDPTVHWYKHEENSLELFADNFSACIKRFVDKD